MSKQSGIRWRKADYEKISREVQRFNAKISRVEKAHPEWGAYQPQRMSSAAIKQSIQTRADLNRLLNSMERYSRKGSEKPIQAKSGNVTTSWEKREYGIKVATINRRRTLERRTVEAIEATSSGQPLGMTRGEMGSVRLNELKPKAYNYDNIRGGKEWEKFKASVDKQIGSTFTNERNEQFKENYIKGLVKVFGSAYPDKTYDLIHNLINSIPAKDFVYTFFKEQQASIDFIYDQIEMEMKLEVIYDIWDNAATE